LEIINENEATENGNEEGGEMKDPLPPKNILLDELDKQ